MLSVEAIKALSEADAIGVANRSIDKASKEANVAALPSDYQLHDFEKYLPNRRRARGAMSTNSVDNFASYVASHAEAGASVFISQENMKATAVLNIGTPAEPGHADNTAVLELKKTAPFNALLQYVGGRALSQQSLAEFLEDWKDQITCYTADGENLDSKKAIAAVRSITIENLRKMENEAEQFSESRSTLDSVKATSKETMPAFIEFVCEPRFCLPSRTFRMRLSITTGGTAPSLSLRIIKLEEHEEQMAEEMRALVQSAIKDGIQVLVGSYQVK